MPPPVPPAPIPPEPAPPALHVGEEPAEVPAVDPFNEPFDGGLDGAALRDAQERTAAFLERHLKRGEAEGKGQAAVRR